MILFLARYQKGGLRPPSPPWGTGERSMPLEGFCFSAFLQSLNASAAVVLQHLESINQTPKGREGDDSSVLHCEGCSSATFQCRWQRLPESTCNPRLINTRYSGSLVEHWSPLVIWMVTYGYMISLCMVWSNVLLFPSHLQLRDICTRVFWTHNNRSPTTSV